LFEGLLEGIEESDVDVTFKDHNTTGPKLEGIAALFMEGHFVAPT